MQPRGKKQGTGRLKAGACERLSGFFFVIRNGNREEWETVRRPVRKAVKLLKAQYLDSAPCDGIGQWVDCYRFPCEISFPLACVSSLLLAHGIDIPPTWGYRQSGRCPTFPTGTSATWGTGNGEDNRHAKSKARATALVNLVLRREEEENPTIPVLPIIFALFPDGAPFSELREVPTAQDRKMLNVDTFGREYYLPDSWLLDRSTWTKCCRFRWFEATYFYLTDSFLASSIAEDYDSVDYWQEKLTLLDSWCESVRDNKSNSVGDGRNDTVGPIVSVHTIVNSLDNQPLLPCFRPADGTERQSDTFAPTGGLPSSDNAWKP